MRERSEWSCGASHIEGKATRVGASGCGQRTSFNRARVAGSQDEVEGVVANMLKLFRDGAVGVIDWLGPLGEDLTDAARVLLLSCAESPQFNATRHDARQQQTAEQPTCMRYRTSDRVVDRTAAG